MVLLLIVFPFTLFASDSSLKSLTIMSFNLPTMGSKNLLESAESSLGQTLPELLGADKHHSNDSEKRLSSATSIIEKYAPAIIGFQETHKEDLDALCKNKKFKSTYTLYAPRVGKSDGDRNAIFYETATFNQIGQGVLYLNEKQEKGHNSWDDKHERACTWLCLQYKQIPLLFYIYNVHLGLTEQSVTKGSKQIAEVVKENQQQNVCAFIIGDFNADTGGLSDLTKRPYNWVNIKNITPTEQIFGPYYTYTGYDGKYKKTPDHIYASTVVNALTFRTITDSPHNCRPSDHYPIMATVELK